MQFILDTERPGRPGSRAHLDSHAAVVDALKALGMRRDSAAALVRLCARTGNPVRKALATGAVVTVEIEVGS